MSDKNQVVEVKPNAHMTQIEAVRAAAEVSGAIEVALRFPRNEDKALERILKSCKRPSFADAATFSFPRAGKAVKGPTIRLIEAIALQWGNIQHGFRELSQDAELKRSVVEAFAYDIERNVRVAKSVEVRWGTDTKQGFKEATDSRGVYEAVANFAMRRVRKCLEAVLPADVIEAAMIECRATLTSGGGIPFEDRKRNLIKAFNDLRISVDMLETRLGGSLNNISDEQLADLREIYNAIKEDPSNREKWFPTKAPAQIEIKTGAKNIISLMQTLAKLLGVTPSEAEEFYKDRLDGDPKRLVEYVDLNTPPEGGE